MILLVHAQADNTEGEINLLSGGSWWSLDAMINQIGWKGQGLAVSALVALLEITIMLPTKGVQKPN
ncbi:hypothetical protein GCM10027098_39170 [Bowmanella dokdonensis]